MNDIYDRPINRRKFLTSMGCAALGTTGLFSTLLNLKMTSKVVAAGLGNSAAPAAATPTATPTPEDFKAIVCIFLAGGNDSYNMLIPTTPAEYATYTSVRSNLAHPITGTGAALPVNVLNTPGRTFAIHPIMSDAQGLFNSGALGFIANTGTLIEPTTVTQYQNGSVPLPKALFSHADQISQWQTLVPQGGVGTGWEGRMTDVLNARVSGLGGSVGMNISLNGNNIMQTGAQTTTYSIGPNGSISLIGRTAKSGINMLRFDQFTSMADVQYQNLFQQTYINDLTVSVDKDKAFANAFSGSQLTTQFRDKSLGADLKAVAQTIAARATLGMRRQIFFVLHGGFDNHQELLMTQSELLTSVSQSLKDFWDALGELKVQDKVVTFTASDFGRTLRSNGRGTDHAWGGNHIVMGGPVIGQQIYGTYPETLQLGGGLDVGNNGRLLPTTSVDLYTAEIALWFGVQPSELATVLPNISNFYTPGSGSPPLGFLKMP